MVWVHLKIGGKWFSPNRLNPFRQPKVRVDGRVSEAESELGWGLMNAAMTQMAGGKSG